MKILTRSVRALAIFSVVVSSPHSKLHADFTTFLDRAAFEAESGPTELEGFENATPDIQDISRTISFARFDVAYNHTPDPLGNTPRSGFGVGRESDLPFVGPPTEGLQFLVTEFGSSATPTSVDFLFTNPVTAFATDLNGLDGFDLSYSTDTGESGLAFLRAAQSENTQFWGFVSSTPVERVTFIADRASVGRDGVAFDNILITAVPEPSAVLLLGGAVTFLCLRRSERNCKTRNSRT